MLGLVCHPASVDRRFRHAVDLLHQLLVGETIKLSPGQGYVVVALQAQLASDRDLLLHAAREALDVDVPLRPEVHQLQHLVRPISPLNDVLAVWEVARLIHAIRPTHVHLNSSKADVVGSFASWCQISNRRRRIAIALIST